MAPYGLLPFFAFAATLWPGITWCKMSPRQMEAWRRGVPTILAMICGRILGVKRELAETVNQDLRHQLENNICAMRSVVSSLTHGLVYLTGSCLSSRFLCARSFTPIVIFSTNTHTVSIIRFAIMGAWL